MGGGRKTQLAIVALLLAFISLTNANAQSSLVGVTDGEASVDPTGAANFRIPLTVPPGRAGMQPELALLYHSRAGNGLLGVGWSLEGLSAVSRCPASWVPDGYSSAVRMASTDRFCLDGQKLVTDGVYGASGTKYRTEIESFRDVESIGAAGTGPDSFRVRTNAGLILEYGTTSDAQITIGSSVYIWALSRITDFAGNSIEFEYGRTVGTHEYWLKEISYDPGNRIVFGYSSRLDESTGYVGGSQAKLGRRLTSVEARNGGSLVRKYNLAYGEGTKTERSLLASVTECDGNGNCLPPTELEWLHGYRQWSSQPRHIEISGADGYDPEPLIARRFADIDGDGWLDLLYWRDDDKWIVRKGPTFISGGNPGPCDIQQDACEELVKKGQLFDRDGVGRQNVMVGPGATNFQIVTFEMHSLNVQSTSIPNPDEGHGFTLTDLNGDGWTDLVISRDAAGFTEIDVHMGLAAGSYAAFNSTPLTHTFLGAGMNEGRVLDPMPFFGGGQSGVAIMVCSTLYPEDDPTVPSCVGQLKFLYWDGQGLDDVPMTNDRAYTFGSFITPEFDAVDFNFDGYRVVDANGDGLPDILYLPFSDGLDNTDWKLLLNNGSRLVPVPGTLPRGVEEAVQVFDWQGDGMATFVVPETNPNVWQYYEWKNGAFAPLESFPRESNDDVHETQFVDLYNRGLPTRLYKLDYEWYADSVLPIMHDLLEKVRVGGDAIDKKTRYFYVPMSNTNFYTQEPYYHQGDFTSFNGAMYLVAHVATDTGTASDAADDNQVFTSYRYSRARTHRQRGFAGFEEVSALNENSNTLTTNWHRIDHPYTGMIWKTEQWTVEDYERADTYEGFLPDQNMYYLMADTCAEPGIEEMMLHPEYCGPAPPPTAPYVAPPNPSVSTLISTSESTLESSAVASAPSSSVQPRVTSSTEEAFDLSTGAQLKQTVTDYTYDAHGSPTRIVATTSNGAGGDIHKVTTDSVYSHNLAAWCLGRVTSASVTHEAPGATPAYRNSTFQYQNCQLVQESVIAAGQTLTTSYELDSFGNRISTTVQGDGVGSRTTSSSYESSGTFVNRVVNALGHTETRQWNPALGTLVQQVGPNGLPTVWTYDSLGRKASEIRPSPPGVQRKTSWEREWCGSCAHPNARYRMIVRESSVVDPSGNPLPDQRTAIAEFDKLGREVATAKRGFNGEWIYEFTEYDSMSRAVAKSLPTTAGHGGAIWSTTAYDGVGRPKVETRPSDAADRTEYAYLGLTTRITTFPGQPEQRVVERSVNVMDRLVALVDKGTPHGDLATQYGYDAVGNTISVIDAEGNATSMTYDNRGFKTGMSAPGMGAWQYSHNAFGELIYQKDARGYEVIQSYDALGRMVSRVDKDPAGNVVNTATWGYDLSYGASIGKLAYVRSVGSDPFWEAYAYDSLGQLTDTVTEVDGDLFQVTTDYDAWGRPSVVQYPDIVTDAGTGPPATPASITASLVDPDDGSFDVTWATVSGTEVRYQIQQDSSDSPTGFEGNWLPIYNDVAAGSPSITITGRANDSYHRYRVRACYAQCSAWREMAGSVHVIFRPAPPGPAQPDANLSESGEIVVSWTAAPSSSIVDEYVLEESTDGGVNWTQIFPGITATTTGMFTRGDGTYHYRVSAENSAGQSAPQAGESVTVLKLPGAPPIATATPELTATGQITVSWDAASGTIDSYLIEHRSRPVGGPWSGWGVPPEAPANVPAMTLSIESVAGTGEHQYRVAATNQTGPSAWTQTGTVTVKPYPWEPEGITVPLVHGAGGSASMSWTKGAGASKSRIFVVPVGESLGSVSGCFHFYEATQALYEQNNPAMGGCGTIGSTFSMPIVNGKYDVFIQSCTSTQCISPTQAPNTLAVVHPPSNLTANTYATSTGDLLLQWTSPGAERVSIQRRLVGGAWQNEAVSIPAGNNTYLVEDLPDGEHEFQVRRELVTGEASDYTEIDQSVSVMQPPGVPASISPPGSPVVTGDHTISWGASTGGTVSYYELVWADNETGLTDGPYSDYQLVYTTAGTSATATVWAMTQYYGVKACNQLGCSAFRKSGAVTGMNAPTAPASVSAGPNPSTNGTINVTWPAGANATSYYVQERFNSGSWTTLSSSYTGTGYTVSGRADGTYRYRVYSKNAVSSSGWVYSNNVSVLRIPGTPSSISVPSSSTNGTIYVSWGTASNTVQRYELWRATNSSFSGATRVYNSTGTAVSLTGHADGTYYFRVRACNTSGCGSYRTGSNATSVLKVPGVPGGLTAPEHSSGSFTVSWGAASGTVSYYQLKKSPSVIYTTSNTYYHFYSQPNGSWYFYVRACNATGCSAYSAPVNVTVTTGGGGPGGGGIEP